MSAITQGASQIAAQPTRRFGIKQRRTLTRLTIIYVGTMLLALFAALPMVWMVSTAIKPRSDVFREPTTIIPRNATLENFIRVTEPLTPSGRYFGTYFLNSTIVSVASSVFSVMIAAPAAYAF
ncbi:MAG: hypothetical protein CUN53_02735, partial [Phototrophicales bacterium]